MGAISACQTIDQKYDMEGRDEPEYRSEKESRFKGFIPEEPRNQGRHQEAEHQYKRTVISVVFFKI